MEGEAGAAGAAQGQAPSDGAPQAGTPPPANGQAPAAPPTPDDDLAGLSEADLRDALKKTRSEAAQHRVKVREYEEKAAEAARAKLTETERLAAERDDAKAKAEALERQVKSLTARQAILESATKAGFRNPEIAYRLLDHERLEYGDDGRPKGVDAELKRLLEREPYLGKAQGGDFGGGPRGGAGSGVDMNALIRRATGRAS
jgi:hypothetical protein